MSELDWLMGSALPKFDGATVAPEDVPRLSGQLRRVYLYMADWRWHTLSEIGYACACSETSASARLRDLRKPRFGSHQVDRKRLREGSGLWVYRMAA